MTIKSKIRSMAKKFGLDINRYNIAQSVEARIKKQLLLKQIDCVLDVGANNGGYGSFLRSAGYNKKIVSFEPLSFTHAQLIETSKSDPLWEIAPRMALGDIESKLIINVAGNSTSSSLLSMLPSHIESAPYSKYVAKENVDVHRLDGLDIQTIKTANRIYLKIDTQGYEMPVLLGAKGLLDKVIGIQLEMSIIPLYEGQVLFKELLAWLDEAGFEMWSIIPGFMNPETGRMLQFDGIFYKKNS